MHTKYELLSYLLLIFWLFFILLCFFLLYFLFECNIAFVLFLMNKTGKGSGGDEFDVFCGRLFFS